MKNDLRFFETGGLPKGKRDTIQINLHVGIPRNSYVGGALAFSFIILKSHFQGNPIFSPFCKTPNFVFFILRLSNSDTVVVFSRNGFRNLPRNPRKFLGIPRVYLCKGY